MKLKSVRKEEALVRQDERNKLTSAQQLASLDKRKMTAKKERARLAKG